MRFCFLLGLALGWVPSLPADILYSVVNLGTLRGGDTSGFGINNAGEVTGWSRVSLPGGQTPLRAFRYSNGQMTDLGTPNYFINAGRAINDSGQIAGYWDRGPEYSIESDWRGFLYSNGQLTELGTLEGRNQSMATGINDAGQVIGLSYYAPAPPSPVGPPRPPPDPLPPPASFLYTNGQMIDLGNLSSAYDINNAGQVVGRDNSGQAALYSKGQVTGLGTLGGNFSTAYSINEAGQVVGDSSIDAANPTPSHAFLYTNGQMTDLGTLGGNFSIAYSINEAGQVVGYFGASTYSHAFLYSNSQMYDLNDLIDPALYITLVDARGINDFGQIVANSGSRAYLLTPITQPGQVPEPSTLMLLGAGLFALAITQCGARTYTRFSPGECTSYSVAMSSSVPRYARHVSSGFDEPDRLDPPVLIRDHRHVIRDHGTGQSSWYVSDVITSWRFDSDT